MKKKHIALLGAIIFIASCIFAGDMNRAQQIINTIIETVQKSLMNTSEDQKADSPLPYMEADSQSDRLV